MFHLYGLIVGIAIVVGWSVAERIEPRVGKLAPGVIIVGLVGARIYHVIDLWDYYSLNWWQILAVWRGGMSIWGGLVGGSLAWWVIDRRWETISAIATALPLTQAIGRIANGVNGEFVSKVWSLPWWMTESVLDLGLFWLVYVP